MEALHEKERNLKKRVAELESELKTIRAAKRKMIAATSLLEMKQGGSSSTGIAEGLDTEDKKDYFGTGSGTSNDFGDILIRLKL